MALTQSDEIIEDIFPFDQASATPGKLRKVFSSGAYRGTTAAMADGYTQGNLAIIPEKYALEPFKMKKYEPNGVDEFGWHVDVNSRNNMERFLAFFLYLSDNEEGKTEFPYQNMPTDCVKGSMVIFPPMWPWYHRGTKPIKVPKYFMGSYLLYVN